MSGSIDLNQLMEEMIKTRDGTGENSIIYQNGVKALKEGRPQEAIELFAQELIKIHEKYGIAKFGLEPKLYRMMGTSYLNLNNPNEAGNCVQQAVSMYKSLKFSKDVELAECYNLKGQIYIMNKLYLKAARKFDRQAKLLIKLRSKPEDIIRAHIEAAKYFRIAQQLNHAETQIQKALTILYAQAEKRPDFISLILLATAINELIKSSEFYDSVETLSEAIFHLHEQKNFSDIGELYIFLDHINAQHSKTDEYNKILSRFPANKRNEKIMTAAAFVYLIVADGLFERGQTERGKDLQLKAHKIPDIDQSIQSIIDTEMVSYKEYIPPNLSLKKIDSTNADELERRGHEHLALNQFEESATLLNKSRIQKKQLFGDKANEVLQIDTKLLQIYQRVGNYQKGQEVFDIILGKVRNANFTKEVAKAIEIIADYAIEIGEYDRASGLANQNLVKNAVMFGQMSQEVARSHQQLGNIQFRTADFQNAMKSAEKAHSIIKALNDSHSKVLPRCTILLAELALRNNKIEDAKMYIKQTQVYLDEHHEEEELVWENNEIIGMLKIKESKFDEALIDTMKILAEKLPKYGDNHLKVVSSYALLGALFFAQKNYTDSKINYEKALSILEGKSKSHADIVLLKNELEEIKNAAKQGK